MVQQAGSVGGHLPALPNVPADGDDSGQTPRSPAQRVAVAASYWTARIVEIAMAFALVGVAVMVCMQVLFRFVLGSPLHYTEEVARYLTIWAALLGASLGVRSGTHFAVTFVVTHVPPRASRVLRATAQLLVAAFLVAFVVTGWAFVQTALVQSSPAAQIPMSLVYAAAPVGGVLMLFFMITAFIARDVRSLPSEILDEDVA